MQFRDQPDGGDCSNCHRCRTGDCPTCRRPARFCVITGWLGWPPSEVWNASIGELEAAFLAHVDRLVKMTPGASANGKAAGGGEYTPDRLRQIEDQGFDLAFDREALRALKSRYGL